MTKHEEKFCPRCNIKFECKVGAVIACQCSTVKLNDEQRTHIRDQYNDCLCAACMKDLSRAYNIQQFKNRIKKLIGI